VARLKALISASTLVLGSSSDHRSSEVVPQ
jgi:hypothetical protein